MILNTDFKSVKLQMDFLALLARRNLREQRVYRDIQDPLDLNDRKLINKYRFDRRSILDLSNELRNKLQRPTGRSHALEVEMQVCIGLRFLACGSFYAVTGDTLGVSKSTVSVVVQDFCSALNTTKHVHFPSTLAECRQVAIEFFDIGGLPRVVGAIDGTHIAIRRPCINEHVFVNRKRFHSLNVQAVCDAKMRFTNVVIKWPGSAHDSFIWNNCAL